MKNDIEAAKDIIITYLETMDIPKAKEEMLKIRDNDTHTLLTHVIVLEETFRKAKEQLEKQLVKEGFKNENIK